MSTAIARGRDTLSHPLASCLLLLAIVATIAVLSLVSPNLKPTFGLGDSLGIAPNHIDHAIAYATAAATVWLVIAPRLSLALAGSAFVLIAAIMELGQFLSPGRTPKVSDFLASSSGAVLGLIVAAGVAHALRSSTAIEMHHPHTA